MKIKYILLENFLGIYAGTGRTKLEIDFSKNKNKIIILNAANGKGKTTLLSLMHPLRSSYDDRSKNLIIPNELGHKICIIDYNNNEYKCEHFYGKKNKSFISKNGKELNENGNIKSFETIIKDELGIDSEYFKIGKIGSNVSNFIDLKTAERKKYINHFIPSIDDYLIAFENVKNHYTNMSAEIKVIKNNIEKYSNLQELDEIESALEKLINNKQSYENESLKLSTSLNLLSEKYNSYKKEINNLINENDLDIGLVKTEEDINTLSTQLDDLDYDYEIEYKKALEEIESFLNKYHIVFDCVNNALYEKFKNIKTKSTEYLNINTAKLNELEKKKNELRNKQIEINNQRNYYDEKIEKVEDDVLSETELELLQSELKTKEQEIQIFKNEIENYESNLDKEIIKDNLNFYEDAGKIDILKNILYSINSIKEKYNTSVIDTCYNIIIEKKKELNKYLSNIEFKDFIEIDNDKIQLEELKSQYTELNKELIELNNKKDFSDKTLKDRPKNCKIDDCKFIKLSIDYANEASCIEEKDKELEKIEKEIKKLEILINSKESYLDFYADFIILNTKIKNYSSDYFYNIINKENLLEKAFINTIDITSLIGLDKFEKYRNYLRQYDILKTSFNETNTKLKNSSLVENLYKEYSDQITNLIKQNDDLIDAMNANFDLIEEGKNAINKNNAKIDICNKFEELYNNFVETENSYYSYKEIYAKFYDIISRIKKFNNDNEINEKTETLNIIKKSIKSTEEKIQNLTTSIQIIKDNMKQLSEIESNFELVNDLKNALDPKKGIPIIFANEYLKNISTKANKLLEVAYGEHFKIRFNVTASDFLVEVYKSDGTFLEDINMASQGETSLTNISLSLAMLECMIDKYNVIYLDEIDCTLSTENRKLFIELLERQIDNLNVDQCFIITHNNEFYNKNVDLILLEGHDCDLEDSNFMQGKNVLLNIG